MARIKVTGRFATAQDTAQILGVSKARTRELIKMVDGILADDASHTRPKPRQKAASRKQRTYAAKSSRSTAKRAARASK